MRRVKIIITGRVQGVGFRFYVKHIADQLEIKGYVRNLPNGNIEIDAEGERNIITSFISECKSGPSLSRVEDCIVQNIHYYGFTNFQIKH